MLEYAISERSVNQIARQPNQVDHLKGQLAGLQIFFKIGGPKWPMEQKMVGHFLKWWAQAYQLKTCLKWPLKKEDQLFLNGGQKYCRMLQGEHSAILSTLIKLSFVIKISVR